MVKQHKIVRDAGGPSKVPSIITASRKSRKRAVIDRRRRRAALMMLSPKHLEVTAEGESDGVSAKVGRGGSDNGAVTPGSYTNGDGSKEFLSTGRTGRRNAMPDILGYHAETGTADLSTRLEALSTTDKLDQPGTSGIGQSETSSSQQQMG